MLRSRFLWKLYAGFTVVILISICAVGYLIAQFITQQGRRDVEDGLAARVGILRELVRPWLGQTDATKLQAVVTRIRGAARPQRVTVIRRDGVVIADSDSDPDGMDNHIARDEIQQALATGTGMSSRYSKTLQQRMTYYAESIEKDGTTIGFVRAAVPVSSIEQRLSELRRAILYGALIASFLGLLTAFVLARRVTLRLVSVTDAAEAVAGGDYEQRIEEFSNDEIGAFARAFNRMSETVQQRFETITEDRNKVIAILRSMVEGVIAIDRSERVVQINTVAARLLHVTTPDAVGSRVDEITQVSEVTRLLADVLATGTDRRSELVLPSGATAQIVELQASPLRDAEGETVGGLVLLHDVTEQRNLETMRRDFVANVSHELKTPLTAIRGIIETIQDDVDMKRETMERFLAMASSQTHRLSALVTDLLTLSRLESEHGAIERRLIDIRDPITTSIKNHLPTALEKKIVIHEDLPDSPVAVMADAEAVRQVVDNLVVNAIKYTLEGGTVGVTLTIQGEHACVEVRDSGVGIEAVHLPRLFERFYRVDKARSRELGGTGLGLAIVKHIMLAHNGDVNVESTVKVGSIFRVRFPLT